MPKIKAWLALQAGKGMMWLIRQGIGWVKSVAPQYAMDARRSSKTKIINQKAAALATPGKADDIAPLGAYVYMGFETMKQAQHKLGEAFCFQSPEGGPIPVCQIHPDRLEKIIREAIHILDESE